MHNPQDPPPPPVSSSSSAPLYFRVPASNEEDADNNYDQPCSTPAAATTSRHHHGDDTAEDPLQQSLLQSNANDDADPESQQHPGNDNNNWESPVRLHCVFQYALDLWWNWIFPRVRRMGNLLFGITILTMLIVVPVVTYNAIEEHRFEYAAFDSSGVMVLGTLVLSFRLVYLHLTHWYMPQVQKYVVRIVWMVPLYAVQSWLSLRFRDARIYIDAIRDLYEAFVIASFLYYLIELLGGQEALVRTLLSKAETRPHLGKHSWPLNYILHDWELGTEFMLQCKHGVLQYVVVKTAATVLTYMFEIVGCYGEGEFQWNMAYPYLAFILNTSVMYALYVLVMLFHAVREELKHPVNWRPLGKFLCVKGVVFFTWWQGVIIFYLKSKDIIKDTGSWSGDEIANALIDYCICTEMVFFAVAHAYTFTYKEYLPSSIPPELRNLEFNATINAHANIVASSTPHSQPQQQPFAQQQQQQQQLDPPLRLEPQQFSVSTASAASSKHSANGNPHASYRPPAVLDRPMNFKEAFWSSSIPKETIEDIRGLRGGVKNSFIRNDANSTSKGSICLSEIASTEETTNAAALDAPAETPSTAAMTTEPDSMTDESTSSDMEQQQQQDRGTEGKQHQR